MDDHGRAEAESCDDYRPLEFCVKPIERGEDIGGFSHAFVLSFAETSAAKIEPKYRPAKAPLGRIHHLHGVIGNFVVHRSAGEGVGMADECGVRRIGGAVVEQSLKAARRTGEMYRAQSGFAGAQARFGRGR
jgi:hypothetical protein